MPTKKPSKSVPPKKVSVKKSPVKEAVKKAVKVVKKTVKDAVRPDPESPLNKGLTDDQATHPDLPPDAHAEAAFAAEDGNKSFGVADEPDAPLSASVIAERAWNAVRGDDPEFKTCVLTHQQKYESHAATILAGSAPMSGDSQLARFEQEVNRITKEN